MRPIDADALVATLLKGGIYPALVKNAINKAPTLKTEDFHKTRLQKLVNFPTLMGNKDIYMCTKCTAKHSKRVHFCSYCGAFVEEILEE